MALIRNRHKIFLSCNSSTIAIKKVEESFCMYIHFNIRFTYGLHTNIRDHKRKIFLKL